MTPYADSVEHLRDELLRLELLLGQYVEAWRDDRRAAEDGVRGLYVSDEEVDSLLDTTRTRREADRDDTGTGDGVPGHERPGSGGPRRVTNAGAKRTERRGESRSDPETRLASVARAIRTRKREALEVGTELRLVELAERFDLDSRQVDALLLALAPDLDRKYGTVYAYLHDDMTRRRPTVGLLIDILEQSGSDRFAVRSVFARGSPLHRHGLLRLSGEEGSLSRTARVDERIAEYLLGSDEIDGDVAESAAVVTPETTVGDLQVDEEYRETIRRIADRCASPSAKPPFVSLSGPDGSGIENAVEAVCVETGDAIVRVDAAVIDAREATTVLDRVAREARLRDAVVHVANLPADAPTPEPARDGARERQRADHREQIAIEQVLQALDPVDGPVFVTGTERLSPSLGAALDAHRFATAHLSIPSYETRQDCWRAVDLPAEVDPADLASKFRLTAGQIADAVSVARSLELTEIDADDAEALSAESIYAGCRVQTRERLESMARQIDPRYTWDDIVLPADQLAHLREVAMHVEHQGRVYADWGFEDRYSHGNGINVLFSGPSGTGKTMAAEVVANDVGLDLFKIDLSSVVSKYIGETEKNLRQVFDEAEHSNAILFFDEADALFGKRTEVRDSHDRYANVEVSYLLQRMEAHDGAVLLASNLAETVDDAFLRRINLRIEFPFPDRESREAIWRGVFPAETPTADLDYAFLSSFELAGGDVKNAALTAAFLAADGDGIVEMEHAVRALRRELRKTGQLVTPEEFGEYRRYLDR